MPFVEQPGGGDRVRAPLPALGGVRRGPALASVHRLAQEERLALPCKVHRLRKGREVRKQFDVKMRLGPVEAQSRDLQHHARQAVGLGAEEVGQCARSVGGERGPDGFGVLGHGRCS
jgi:hypothetical protein